MFCRTAIASIIFAATAAHASSPASLSCDGAFNVVYGPATTIDCRSNLVIRGGEFSSIESIKVDAAGSILLDAVSFNAPSLVFNAGSSFASTADTKLSGQSINIDARQISINGLIDADASNARLSAGAPIQRVDIVAVDRTAGKGWSTLKIGSGSVLLSPGSNIDAGPVSLQAGQPQSTSDITDRLNTVGGSIYLRNDGGIRFPENSPAGFIAVTSVPSLPTGFTLVAASVPEPATYAMMALGLLGIAASTRRRR